MQIYPSVTKVSFNNKEAGFYKAINAEADSYFKSHQIKKTGNAQLYIKTVILISAALMIYLSVLLISTPWYLTLTLGLLLGIVSACIGFNVMHDANHGSYSSRKWINETLSLTMNALGGNSFIWKYKHNILHHTYPNVDGVDDDIAKSPLIRMCETQPWKPAHRIQHLYTPLLYALSSLIWVLFQDFEKYFKPKLSDEAMSDRMKPADHVIFWISKLLYIFFYIVLPIWVTGWSNWLIFFLALHAGLGFTLAIVFQLAHVVESTIFESVSKGETKKLPNEWAIHQVLTTANFSPRSKVITWLAGGLNYQVEHHLFPRVSHIHYPALSKIVKEKCVEFNLPYHSIPTLGSAISSHFRFIKMLGKKPVQAA